MADVVRPSLFSQITVEHGPAALLGRVFLLCEAQLRERGVSLAFASMSDLVAVNQANSDSWAPLWSGFNPAFSNLTRTIRSASWGMIGGVMWSRRKRHASWTGQTPTTSARRRACVWRMPIRRRRSCRASNARSRRLQPEGSRDAWSTPALPGTGGIIEAPAWYRCCRVWSVRSPTPAGPPIARSP